MKRKLVAAILAMVLILAVACPGVGACGLDGWKQTKSCSITDARFAAAEKLVSDCNRTVELMVRCAQLTPYYDVPALLCSVNALIDTTTALVRALGLDVECTYTQYIVDGQLVMIDPLRVINPIVHD